MVSLSPNFTTLAVFCGLAAMLCSPLSVSAVAINARDVAGHPTRQQTLVLPLPLRAMKKSAAKKNKKVSAFLTHLLALHIHNNILKKRYYYDQVHFHDESTVHGGQSPAHVARRHHHNKIIVKGNNDQVNVHRRSSLIVHGQNGQSYVVLPRHQAPSVIQRSTDSQAYFDSEDSGAGTAGRVDIMASLFRTFASVQC